MTWYAWLQIYNPQLLNNNLRLLKKKEIIISTGGLVLWLWHLNANRNTQKTIEKQISRNENMLTDSKKKISISNIGDARGFLGVFSLINSSTQWKTEIKPIKDTPPHPSNDEQNCMKVKMLYTCTFVPSKWQIWVLFRSHLWNVKKFFVLTRNGCWKIKMCWSCYM